MVWTRSQTKWLEIGRIGRPAWTPIERNAVTCSKDARKTEEEEEPGNTDEVATTWKSLYKSARAEVEQQQRKQDSLLSCLQKVDSERKTAQEDAESRHKEALKWRKQCEAAQCEARAAASAAEKKEQHLQVLEKKMVEQVLSMNNARKQAVKIAAEAHSSAGAAVQRAVCAEQREQAALQRVRELEQREQAALQRMRELEERERAALQRVRELEEREQAALQEADEADEAAEESKAECEKLRKAWESAKALLLAAQQQHQQQEALRSQSSASEASAAQDCSSSAAAGAESWSQMDPATRLLKHQLSEKDHTIRKLQEALGDLRRVAAQVAAERQAATPLPPIAPRPQKRRRTYDMEAMDDGLSASDGAPVRRPQSAQAAASAGSAQGPVVQQQSGAPASAARPQATLGTSDASPVQDASGSGVQASAGAPQAASGAPATSPAQCGQPLWQMLRRCLPCMSLGRQDTPGSGLPASATPAQAASGASDASPVQHIPNSGVPATAAASQAKPGASDASPAQDKCGSGVSARAAASQAASGTSATSPVQDTNSGVPATAAPTQAASGASDASPMMDTPGSANPPGSPQGAASQEPKESTCPAVSNTKLRPKGDYNVPAQPNSPPAAHSGETPEVASSMNEERPSVTPTAAEQGSHPGAPDEQCRTEALHEVARELLWDEKWKRLAEAGCKGAKGRKRLYEEHKASPLPPSKLSRRASSADTGDARQASAKAAQVAAVTPQADHRSSSQPEAEPMAVDTTSAVEESSAASGSTTVPCDSTGIPQHCSTATSPMAHLSGVPSSPHSVLPGYCRTGPAHAVSPIGLAH